MATSALSPFCRPEEDPFQPLRRTWIEHPYGEEEIALLEEEVLPAIKQSSSRCWWGDGRVCAALPSPSARIGSDGHARSQASLSRR
jgi:hypothetical protein